jgi:hypothetical protein
MLSSTKEQKENGISFEAYTLNWMERYKGSLKETTRKGYVSYLSKHLLPSFGNMNLLEISVDDIQDYLNDRKHLARKTLREHLFSAPDLDIALRTQDCLPPRAARNCAIPRHGHDSRGLPLEVAVQILRDIAVGRVRPQAHGLLLLTGMRRGECGLRGRTTT